MVFVNFYHNYNFFYLKYTFFVVKRRVYPEVYPLDSRLKLYLRTSDKFYPTDRHFYPLDSTIQASCNAISTLDKIYPSDSDLIIRWIVTYPPFEQPAPDLQET